MNIVANFVTLASVGICAGATGGAVLVLAMAIAGSRTRNGGTK